jgi:hypothetical protein
MQSTNKNEYYYKILIRLVFDLLSIESAIYSMYGIRY